MQTAHDAAYLVKHLLAGMPAVTERVQQMRAGRAPQSQSDNQARNIQSQACSPALRRRLPSAMSMACRLSLSMQGSQPGGVLLHAAQSSTQGPDR